MITFEKDKVIIPRTSWDKLKNNSYYHELIEVLIDSEELQDAIDNSKEMIELREYDRNRRMINVQN